MDERTEELRDIFVETTGAEGVTERQRDDRGSLADGEADEAGVRAVIDRMRERYGFDAGLGTDALVRVVEGFFDGRADEAVAADLGVDSEAVFRARMDLHLVDEADRNAPFDLDELRSLVAEGADGEACAAALDADAETVERYRRVVAAEAEARRANGRFRDEFAELLTDADLSTRLTDDAREDGLAEATEDLETDVSF